MNITISPLRIYHCLLLVSPPAAALLSVFRTSIAAAAPKSSSSSSLYFHGPFSAFSHSPQHPLLHYPQQNGIVTSRSLPYLPSSMPPRRSNRTLTVLAAGGTTESGDTVDNDPTNANDGDSSLATTTTLNNEAGDATPTNNKKTTTKQKVSTKKTNNSSSPQKKSDIPTNEIAPKKRKSKGLATDAEAGATTTTTTTADEQDANHNANDTNECSPPPPATKKKTKAPTHQQWTERTPLAKLWDAQHASTESTGSYTFTILSWNVAGLRALIKNHPDTLGNLVKQYNVDVLSLQETKLQEGHMDDVKLKLREYFDETLGGEYDGYFSYSIEKKGYSGTAMFIKRWKRRSGTIDDAVGEGGDSVGSGNNKGRGEDNIKKKKQTTLGAFFAPTKKEEEEEDDETPSSAHDFIDKSSSTGDVPLSHLQPIKVETTLGLPAHDGEGRTITAEFPLFHLTNVYVPNSGQNLDRLAYRTQQWDTDFLAKMQQLEKDTKKLILWFGDLNVAHNEKDTWNEGAKHLAKSAGTTAEERASFARQLEAGYVDAFRHLHPEGRGHYTYWSQRAGNRAPNKGLRLDYFICSKELMEDDADGNGKVRVRDCFMVPEILGSDHCPIVLEMEIKK